ncbi:MAG TPA: hypothetical protein VLY03_07810 [Bacteroidota bacterium]|nr:hypothetical protein [Bacteroidota bacterium]
MKTITLVVLMLLPAVLTARSLPRVHECTADDWNFQNLAEFQNEQIETPIPDVPEMNLSVVDSIQPPTHTIKLLPDHLSPMESFLWGEGGVLRSTGFAPLTPPARKSELGVRRTMLTIHQIGGFVTMGLFIPTLIIGQRNLANWNGSEAGQFPLDRKLNNLHQTMGVITFISYMTTASFAIFSPPPLIRRDEWSTTSLHKTLAWFHFAGMVATPILGILSARKSNTLSEAQNLRTAHQITAYATATIFSVALITMTF